jgi:hypothetical protein
MEKRDFTVNDFVGELQSICGSEPPCSFSLRVESEQRWPHFNISSDRGGTPSVQGYFVESGTSFWQISNSGREVFTGDFSSSTRFIEEIRTVIQVLRTEGCIETRWSENSGKVVRSIIRIEGLGSEIIFGKAPHFWSDLIEEKIRFEPFC